MEPGEEEVDKQQVRRTFVSHIVHCMLQRSPLHLSQTAQINPLRGFDRLASVGFSREDIDNFRQQFHSQSSENYLDLDFATEEECMSLYLPQSIHALTRSISFIP